MTENWRKARGKCSSGWRLGFRLNRAGNWMIQSVLIFNTAGKARLSKHYTALAPASRAKLLTKIFDLVSTRASPPSFPLHLSADPDPAQPDSVCNFVDFPTGLNFPNSNSTTTDSEGYPLGDDGEGLRVIYRHYATLYFVFVVDQSESELGILDLIQVRSSSSQHTGKRRIL